MSLGGLQSIPSSQCVGSCSVFSGIISVPKESGGTVGSPKNCDVPRGGAGVSSGALPRGPGGSEEGTVCGHSSCHHYCHYSCLFPQAQRVSHPLLLTSQTHPEPLAAPFLAAGALSKLSWGSALAFPAPLTGNERNNHRWDAGWELDTPLHVPGPASLHRRAKGFCYLKLAGDTVSPVTPLLANTLNLPKPLCRHVSWHQCFVLLQLKPFPC